MSATTLVLAACAVALSCDGAPRPVTTAAHLSDVPRPAIDWRPEVYAAPLAASAPVIDGSLDDPVWQTAPWTADFVDIRGGSTPAPRHRTRARLLWNEEYLFIGASMEEPHVWGTLTERDAVIYYDNDFEVFIDPDADTHLYYELEINALDTVWDLMLIKPYRDGGPAIDAWDIQGLRTGVDVDGTLNDPMDEDRGWSIEIAIPWAVLEEAAGRPVPPAPGDRWRFNFSRVQWRSEVDDGQYVKQTDPETGEPLDEDNWVWSSPCTTPRCGASSSSSSRSPETRTRVSPNPSGPCGLCAMCTTGSESAWQVAGPGRARPRNWASLRPATPTWPGPRTCT
jgi:hypothetical protein